MTSKEKAIEALDVLHGKALMGDSEVAFNSFDCDMKMKETDRCYDFLFSELSKPTLDDAIKCVKDICNELDFQYQHNELFYQDKELIGRIKASEHILTALKGLKEGKE